MQLRTSDDPELWNEKKLKQILEKLRNEDDNDEAAKIMLTFGFENDYVLIGTVSEEYKGLVIELRRKLIKDFDCKSHAEMALVDMAVSGYMRVVRSSQAFTRCLGQGSTTDVLNQFMSIMSKETDRANRHFLTAYQMLMQLKRPQINVNVRTKNAFVAQAQQFNTSETDRPKPEEEIINSK